MKHLEDYLRERLVERIIQLGYTSFNDEDPLSELINFSKRANDSSPYRELGRLVELAVEEMELKSD
jgi:peptide subunit release factor 1 (eRF1)